MKFALTRVDTKTETSQEKAYHFLKEAILDMALPPGSALRSEALAAQIDVSRTPVREALSRLEQERLVERGGGWGYIVRAITLKEAMDLYRVREALEVEAVREAIPRVQADTLVAMRSALKVAGDKVRQGKLHQFRENTRLFYRLIVEVTDNACLTHMLSIIDDRVRLLGAMMAQHHIDRPKESLEENRAVLDALEKKDADGAEAAVRTHVSRARETLLTHVMREGEVFPFHRGA